jgi:hypothetical protein
MSDASANPKKFRLSPGGAIGFDDNEARVAVAWPEFNERPEDELLGRLKESGATFPDEAVALEIIRTSDLFDRAGQLESNQIFSQLIHRLTHGKCNRQILETIHLSAFQLHLPGYRTQNDLAEKLKVSQGRVSQLISKIAKNR